MRFYSRHIIRLNIIKITDWTLDGDDWFMNESAGLTFEVLAL